MEQKNLIYEFLKNSKYYSIVYSYDNDEELGRIIKNEELKEIDFSENEIHRSIEYRNDDRLFVIDFVDDSRRFVDNNLQIFLNSFDDARAVEEVYPNIFTWVFDGFCIKGYAIVPSGSPISHPTISRYGGTSNFISILRRHLKNIAGLKKGKSPDYNFSNLQDKIKETEISIGSFNKKYGNYSIVIDLKDSWKDILKNSTKCISLDIDLTTLKMKYWTKEVNPDFISEAKHIKLNNPIRVKGIDERKIFDLYPAPIKRLMALQDKGNYNRYLLARFLLSVHAPDDAKHLYYTIIGINPKELDHVKSGNCSTQWNYIINNLDKYDCPSMKELKSFIKEGDEPLSHPLEKIQELINKQLEEEKNDE